MNRPWNMTAAVRSRRAGFMMGFMVALAALSTVPVATSAGLPLVATAPRGGYSEDLQRLAAAIERDPSDALAWFERGRVIALAAGGTPPADYCEVDDNWIFLALAHLSESVRIDQARFEPMLVSDLPGLAYLRKTTEYAHWRVAIQPLPASDAALREFLAEHRVWNRQGRATPIREAMTLRPDGTVELFARGRTSRAGTWSVSQLQVRVRHQGRTTAFPLVRTAFALKGGTLRFPVLTLGREWTFGRILHDCDF